MERRIGPLRAEVVDPESAKFTAPLLLLHGLWSTPAVWRPFTGYLAHRGWLSVAPYLAVAEHGDVSIDAYLARLRAMIAALPAPPIIVGHDLGGAAALGLADVATALVALAPLVLPPLAAPPDALRAAGTWIGRLTSSERPLGGPRGRWRTSYPAGRTLTEPARSIRNLTDYGIDLSAPATPQALPQNREPSRRNVAAGLVPASRVPRGAASPDDARGHKGPGYIPDLLTAPVAKPPALVVIGDQDAVTPLAAAQALAAQMGAELQIEAGAGHALPTDQGWEQRVSQLHRWIVHAVGQRLLALFDESFDQ